MAATKKPEYEEIELDDETTVLIDAAIEETVQRGGRRLTRDEMLNHLILKAANCTGRCRGALSHDPNAVH